MEIMDKIKNRREEEEKFVETYKKELEKVKRIIKRQLDNPNGYELFDFLKKYLFVKDNKIDVNPQVLAYNQGKESVYNFLMTLIDEEMIINFLESKKNGK